LKANALIENCLEFLHHYEDIVNLRLRYLIWATGGMRWNSQKTVLTDEIGLIEIECATWN